MAAPPSSQEGFWRVVVARRRSVGGGHAPKIHGTVGRGRASAPPRHDLDGLHPALAQRRPLARRYPRLRDAVVPPPPGTHPRLARTRRPDRRPSPRRSRSPSTARGAAHLDAREIGQALEHPVGAGHTAVEQHGRQRHPRLDRRQRVGDLMEHAVDDRAGDLRRAYSARQAEQPGSQRRGDPSSGVPSPCNAGTHGDRAVLGSPRRQAGHRARSRPVTHPAARTSRSPSLPRARTPRAQSSSARQAATRREPRTPNGGTSAAPPALGKDERPGAERDLRTPRPRGQPSPNSEAC